MILCFTLCFGIFASIWTASLSARSSILNLSRFQIRCSFKQHHQPCYGFSSSASHMEYVWKLRCPVAQSILDFWQLWGPKPSGVMFLSMLVRRSLKLHDGYACKSILSRSVWFPSETCIAAFPIAKRRDG